MNFLKYFLFLQCLISPLSLVVASESTEASTASTVASDPSADKSRDLEKKPPVTLPVQGDQPVPTAKKIKTDKPFILRGGLGEFSSNQPDELRMFDGMKAFLEFIKKEGVTVYPIADFAWIVVPDGELKYQDVVRAHAAKIGADIVVMITDPREIREHINASPMQRLVYCGLAYKQAHARLGIQPDTESMKKKHMKIAGFLPGSRAQEVGLQVGDLVRSVDGAQFGSPGYWSKALRWNAGEKVKVAVERDGKPLEFEIELIKG
jgi:hypothetical protein